MNKKETVAIRPPVDEVVMALLPCPFCGSKARITTKKPILPNGQRDTLYVVSCEMRECMVKTRAWYPLSAAVATWNRRAKDKDRDTKKLMIVSNDNGDCWHTKYDVTSPIYSNGEGMMVVHVRKP